MGAAVIHVAQTGSTNGDLLEFARRGEPEGRWLRADRQTAGRGRMGRPWVSPPGNLYASTLVRLRPSDPPTPTLALVAAVALEEVVARYIPPERLVLKWPNDLLVEGAKLSGILLERAGDAVVIGIGVNLAHHPALPDRATTSLAAHGIVPPAADAFLERLAPALASWIARWRDEGLAPVRDRWLARAHALGTSLAATAGDDRVTGRFDGLAADGALRLRLADGAVRIIHAGDVAETGA